METATHRALKSLALTHLQRLGCCAAATEVQSPIPRHRVDVAGYSDGPPLSAAEKRAGSRRRPFTVIIECKASRADFLRDTREREALLRRRSALEAQRVEIEQGLLRAAEPHLQRPGEFLFPEMDPWDCGACDLPGYHALIRELIRLDRAVYGETKFCLLAAWRMADRLYIAAPRGVVRVGETPHGWGLLEFDREWVRAAGEGWTARPAPSGACEGPERPEPGLEAWRPIERVEAATLNAAEKRRARLLRNIAVAGTRVQMAAHAPSTAEAAL